MSPYLKFLGPAIGTKFLYFLTATSDTAEPTPVMDAVVRRWFHTHADNKLITGSRPTDSYRTYLDSPDAWRGQLPAGPHGKPFEREDLELLIFKSSRGDNSGWETAPETLVTDQMLDLLQGDVDEIAERSGSPGGPVMLRLLSNWVAQSGATDTCQAHGGDALANRNHITRIGPQHLLPLLAWAHDQPLRHQQDPRLHG